MIADVSPVASNTQTLRFDREQTSRLLWALLLSLLVHALIYTGYQANRRYHWLDHAKVPAWLNPAARLVRERKPPTPLTAPPELTIQPMQFVEVSNPSAEAPVNARNYSTANSQAANPDASAKSEVPKIDGKDTRMVKTETITKPSAQPLRPAVAPTPPAPKPVQQAAASKPDSVTPKADKAQEELKPNAAQPVGDLTLARPADTQRKGEGRDSQARPRTLKEAYARLAQQNPEAFAGLVGPKMKQEGGVKNRNLVTSLDAKATAYGAYDAALIYAVQNRWYALLDAKGFAGEHTGKVNLQFRLHYDGRVTEMKVNEASVDDLLSIICQRAVLDNAPYERWPTAMRNEIGADFRDVTFTFFYY